MKTIISAREESDKKAAQQLRELLERKADAVLAFSAGRSMTGLFRELGAMVKTGELSLAKATFFAVTEYEDVEEGLSCRRQLEEQLLSVTDLEPEHCHFLSEGSMESYEDAIQSAGGLDMVVLGLGDNAHIGFNEPATPFDSYTHRQKLTDATRRQSAWLFGSEEAVPTYGYTMGIKTLVSAREILVLAYGEEKAGAVHKMLYGRNDSAVPAAFLQIPLEVTVYLDEAAASKL